MMQALQSHSDPLMCSELLFNKLQNHHGLDFANSVLVLSHLPRRKARQACSLFAAQVVCVATWVFWLVAPE